jgi:hypothetical protein
MEDTIRRFAISAGRGRVEKPIRIAMRNLAGKRNICGVPSRCSPDRMKKGAVLVMDETVYALVRSIRRDKSTIALSCRQRRRLGVGA